MDSAALTRQQVSALGNAVGRHLSYLGRLRTRMEKTGFPPTDPLYQQVQAAWETLHALRVSLHYLGCVPGSVGK